MAWLRRERPPAGPPTKLEKHAARLSTNELRTWGSTVGAYASERCEKEAADVRDDIGEIREAAAALAAVADELEKRTVGGRRA